MKLKSMLFMFIATLLLCCYTAMSYGYTLPATGQTTCYDATGNVITCAGTGQDGAHIINSMSYTYNGDGTVTDNVTGLMWQQSYYEYVMSEDGAARYCTSLSLGGHSDWRLPTVLDLLTIVDYSGVSPATNATFFPYTETTEPYWAINVYESDESFSWAVGFDAGEASNHDSMVELYARCVRGSSQFAESSLTANGNGTVTDSSTRLTWQQTEPGQMAWTNALSYCSSLNLGGVSGWRLPDIKELTSIADYLSTTSVAINSTFFPNAAASSYISSTSYAKSPYSSWAVDFSDGGVNYGYPKSGVGYVRCVNGGNSGTAQSNFTISLSIAGTASGSGTVTSSPTGISCGSTCSASYASGTSVTLTAAANPGSTFTGWSGACSGQNASSTCVVTMNEAQSVTANYTATEMTPFGDITPSESFASYIEAIYNNGITAGCGNGNYCPSDYVTRDQMAAFIVRATQVEAGQSPTCFVCTGGTDCATETPYFNDVPAIDAFFPYIQKLKELGVTTGCGNNDYCPNGYVTRDQMAAFIIRALYPDGFTCTGGIAGAAVGCATTTPYFNDVSAADTFFPYVQKLKELGITTGCGNSNYCPSEEITRDQMAAFLARAFLGMKGGSAPTLVSIAITSSFPSLALGSGEQFTAIGTYSDSSTQNITSSVTWSSSNTNIATIGTSGIATGVAKGSVMITAISGAVGGSATLIVTSGYTISGTVTTSGGTAISGVTMTLGQTTPTSTTTDINGHYTFTEIANGVYTITPSLTGYTFTPVMSIVTVVDANVSTGQNFTGVGTGQQSISGGVAADGSVTSGTGFTISHLTPGEYAILFNPPLDTVLSCTTNAAGCTVEILPVGMPNQTTEILVECNLINTAFTFTCK